MKTMALLLMTVPALMAQASSYRENCAACHGMKGDGKGLYAARLTGEKPRDFTQANFRFRSTASGSLPSRDDLARVIRNGVPLSSMPAFADWADPRGLEEWTGDIMDFSKRWKEEGPGEIVRLPARTVLAANGMTRLKGRALYALLKCGDCHGNSGRGDGEKAGALLIPPRDFTPGKFKSGPSDADLVRSFMLGLDGTPMASFADALPGQRPWYLLDYIRSFEEKQWFARLFLFPAR